MSLMTVPGQSVLCTKNSTNIEILQNIFFSLIIYIRWAHRLEYTFIHNETFDFCYKKD